MPEENPKDKLINKKETSKNTKYTYKTPYDKDGLEHAKLTWDEYKYRHEFCWNLMSRITVITTTLSIIPYLDKQFSNDAKPLVNFTPFIGILFAIFGTIRLCKELKMLDKIRNIHRDFQNTTIIPELYRDKSYFTSQAIIYMGLLIILAIINFILINKHLICKLINLMCNCLN